MLINVIGWTNPFQWIVNIPQLSHFNTALWQLPHQNSTLFCKFWPIITPKLYIFFSAVKCTRWREILVRRGCTWKIKILNSIYTFQNCWVPSSFMNSRAASIMCSIIKLHYLNSLLILHKSGQTMCQPVQTVHFNWTWQYSHSFELYIIIWCQTMKQIPTVYTKTALHLQKIVSHTD